MKKRPPARLPAAASFSNGRRLPTRCRQDELPPEPPLPPDPDEPPLLDRPPREPVPRALVPRVDFVPPVERLPVPERAPDARLLDVDPPDFAARVEPDLEPAELDFFAVPPLLERELEDFARELLLDVFAPDERVPVERLPVDLADDLPELPDERPELLDEPPSSPHLPLITRCAASATASAISEPRRVALDIAVLAAFDAASAASRPASRILRRAAGLALIAAAAAANPAAIISRLIATLVILSTVVSFELDEEPEEDVELLFLAFAIAGLPLSPRKTLQKRNGSAKTAIRTSASLPTALRAGKLKGTAGGPAIPFDMVSGRRFRPFPC